MVPGPVEIKTVYSFVASTILLDLGTPMGEAMVPQLHSYACQKLQEGDSEFKRLYRQVEKEETPSVLGTGMSESVEGQGDAFMSWLKSQGIDATDTNRKKKLAVFCGDAQNPQTGLSFSWCVSIYFDMEPGRTAEPQVNRQTGVGEGSLVSDIVKGEEGSKKWWKFC